MFKSEQMQRVRVYGEKEKLKQLVESLYEFGAIHVTQAKHEFVQEYGEALDTFKDVSSALIAIRTAERVLNLTGEASDYSELNLKELLKECKEQQIDEVVQLNEAKEKIKTERANLEKRITDAEPFALFGLNKNFASVKSVSFTLFQTTSSLELLKKDFEIENTSIAVKESKGIRYCLAGFERSKSELIAKAIPKHASKVIIIPEIESKNYKQEIEMLSEEVQTSEKMILEIDAKLEKIKKTSSANILGLKEALKIESKKAQLPFNFAKTVNLIAVEGWVQKKTVNTLENELNKKMKTVHVEFIETNELAPTKMKNPRPLNAFEEMVKFFSLPKSTEIDPTLLVAVSFPIFFGMIIGDIGHSLMALLLAFMIKAKMKSDFWQAAGGMLAISAISGIIFGFIFAEFFGFNHILGYKLTPIIHRMEGHGLEILMALVILLGMIHLAIGYVLGAYQSFKRHHAKHGAAKLSWLLLEISLAIYMAAVLKVGFLQFVKPIASVITPPISGPLIIVALLGIILTEGIIALFEIPGLLSNIFSYLRIMALGVSAAVIALILDKIPEAVSFADPVSIIGAFLLLVLYALGQTLAMALAVFESMIQSIRLQYVEFFSKFFEGGGNEFVALNPEKKY